MQGVGLLCEEGYRDGVGSVWRDGGCFTAGADDYDAVVCTQVWMTPRQKCVVPYGTTPDVAASVQSQKRAI